MDDKNAQELNALEEAAFNDPVKFLNEQHAPRTWTMSTEDLARTAAVSPYEIMATSEERWGPEKASIATTAVREFVRGFAGMADSTVNGIMEDRAKEIIYRSPNMRQQDANRLIEDVMRSGSLARQIENYESSKTAHDNFTAGISNGLGSMVSLALLGWATRSPAVVGAAAGLGEAYNAREEMVDRYIQEMGTAEGLADQLGKYNALSTGYGVFAGFVEGSIGVERLAAGALNRYGRLAAMERLARQQGRFGRALAYKTGRQVVTTGLEEGGEEFLQSIGQDVAVALTRDMWENPDIKKALIQAGYGAIIGSTSGGVMYNIGRKRAIDFIRRWNDENNAGLTESQIVRAADAALDDVAQPMVDEIATRAELRNQYGQAYEVLKNRFRQQIESTGTTPWTDQNKSMEEYIDTLASTLSIPAVLQANGLNIPTAQFLEIADMVVQDNVLQLVPLNNAAELEDIIARQTNVLAQQREAKKLGMGDDTARQTAERRKAIAQKALRNLREEERIRKQIVQEKRKADKKRLGYDEIDQAKKDTKFLKNARTLDSFKAKLEDGTTTEQAKNRLEAAFMNWIADKDKTLAEDLILYRGGMQKAVDLLTANAKVIYDTAKKHPGAGLREDIANALRKLRHTNKDNFLLVTQALARDGHDVMPENILLWHWVFADPTTNNQFLTNYTTKLAENREQVADGQALFGQKVAPLSKKDLIMQALQDTDQAKAQLAESRGRKYEPLFDKNGAVKEPYLAAAIVSYQNQFAPRFAQQMPRLFQEQFDLANENARLDEIYPPYDGDTIEVDGKVRTVYNSEGERINKSAEALTNFWRWFGDSKVVDEQGRPLVVYHGSKINNLEILDSSLGDSETYGSSAGGTYLTSNYSVAMTYMRDANAKEIKEIPENNIVLLEYGTNLYEIDSKTGNFTGRIFNQDGWYSRQYKLSDETGTPDLSWYKEPRSLVILNENLKSIAGINDYKFNGEDYIKQAKQLISDLDSKETGKIYPVYLKMKKPLVLDFEGESFNGDFYDGIENIIRAIKKKRLKGFDYNFEYELPIQALERYAREHNYDGLIVKNVYDNADAKSLPSVENIGDDYVVFDSTQIKSVENLGYYNAQDPRMLYQPSYVSLKGELIGDYIDADLHLGRGDNTRVWLWGNYMLLNEKIDKEHYFDRFEKEGPRLTYEGKEITPKVLDELGFSNEFYVTDQIRGNLMDYARSILYTKEDLISSTEKYLKQYEDVHKYYLKRATDRLVRRGWDRKEVKQMVKDMEAIALGEEGWAGAALMFNKGTPEYEIQKKYRDSEGRLDDKFTELYVELTKEFDEIESQFRSYNGFIGSVRRVDAIRKALDAIKKMDWNKLGGRTGFAYKGESFTGTLSQIIADTGLYEYDKNDVFFRVDKKLRRALKEKKDVQAALKSLDEEYTKFTDLVPSANKAIEETVDKYKDDYPAADPKAVVDAIEKYMVKPQTPLRGIAPSLLIFNEGNLSPADDDLLRKVAGSRESGIELPDWEYKDNKPTIADIVARIKTAETRLAILRHVQNFFKDATNADFNYKPMATMVETEAPENYELLNASRPLDRQPKQVQQAIIDTIREYAPKYPELHLEDNLYSGIGRTLSDEQARMFSKMFDIDLEVSNAFLQDEVERKVGDAELEQVPDDLWMTMYEAIDYALTMKENPKFSDIIDGLKKRRKYIEENGYFNYHKDLQQKHFIIIDYLLDQANKQPKKTPVSEFTKELSNFKGVELHDNNAFKFLDRLNSYMNLNPDVYESLKKDTSLGLTQNPPSDEIIIKMFRKHGIKGLKYYGHRDKRGVVTWQKTPVTRLLYSLDIYDDLTTTDSIGSVTNVLQQLKDGSHERLLFDARNGNWYLADADKMVHADMFVRAFRQGNYPEFNNEREAEQYFQENYLSDDPTLLQFLATKYDSPADAKQAMEHTLGTDEYTHAYLRDGLVVFARSESDLRDSGFPVEQFDHYKAEYDENNNRQIVLVERAAQTDGRSLDADYRWQPINPKSVMPNVRGGWTKEKILRYLKSWGSHFGAVKAVKEISNFDSVEDFKNHVFYHGARYGTSGSMSPSITMSDRKIGNIGGGGYGEKYWAISVTKSKRVAGNFATAMDDGNIYPILLAKNAKVIEMPELTDSADLEDHIVDLYNQGVDAVWIGDKNAGEQELAVINPRAIINIGKADFYRAFRLGSEENPIRMKTDKDFETIFEFAKDYRNKDEETRAQEAREVVYWQGRRAKVRAVYDPELLTVILGKDWNELSLVHEFHHHYLKKIWDYFKQAQAGMRTVSKAWMDDTQRLFSMLEIDPNQKGLTTVQQEKFAYMVEAYLTGLGVENQDNLAFQGFLHWIPEKYRSIMDLGYLDANGQIQNPMLDEESIAFFNKWFASPLVPSLPSAPDAQRIMNASDEDGEIIPSNQKVMNNREKEWGQDSEIQNKADAQLWRGIGENTPSDMRAALDGEKELMKVETNNMPDDRKLPVATKPTLREKWFKTRQPDARETAAEAARAYLAKNPEHARELAFADPETLAEFDAPVDQGMLIRAVMETVNKGSDEWYVLDNNLAMVKSMSGSTLSLSGDLSHQAYLDAKREIEMARELKAITNYAGTGRGAAEKWNGDIRAFAARRTAAILATEPNSEERKAAIEAFLEEAKTKFSGNTTNAVLNQLDLTGYQTKSSQVFIKWAEKQIKNVSHARLDAKEQAELMKASVAAQLALQDIDSKELKDGKYVRAVQSSKDIRHWQFVKDKMKKAYIGRWGKFGIFWDNLWGSYAPSAMLMSANTLFFANVPSTAINTGTIRLAALSIGENNVDKNVQKGEIKRIKQIFNASGMNIAQMDKPTSPSLLHGEKYTQQEQKHWYNFTFDILGREDNVFRVPTFVDALARIATKNANGDAKKATALFNEYTKLNTTDDEAKIARKQALAVANMAVFTQDGIMASALNHIRSSLNTMTRGALGLEPGGFGLGNILAPFLKTGANITEMGLSAALALPRTAIAIAQNKLLGKEIPDVRRIALISDWINLAWTAVVIAVLAAISGDDDDWYTEPYESGKRYDPDKPYDSVRFGNTWVKLDIFGPMAIPLRTALKVVEDWEKKKLSAVADGLAFGGMEALSDTPLVNQFIDNQVDYMTKQPGAYWSSFGYNQLNKLVPAQVKTLTKAGSRATGVELDTPWMGKALDRKFHRNYGLDGERLTTNDLINIFTNRLKYKP